mgnify:CR=1 FL=1|jgi:hypothetical protein
MALPNIVAPEFTTTLPSDKTEVKFRPFLVKEEKLLLFAAESEERKEMVSAVSQMMKNCIISPDIEPNDIPFFDFEHLLLHIRSKSVGETAEFMLTHDTEECGHRNKVSARVDNIVYKTDDNHSDKIPLNDELGVKMKYPTIGSIGNLSDVNNPTELLNIVIDSIEYVYDNEKVYDDFSKEEASTFLESLSKEQFTRMSDFFSTMPSSKIEVKYECEKCKEKVEYSISGFESFFS